MPGLPKTHKLYRFWKIIPVKIWTADILTAVIGAKNKHSSYNCLECVPKNVQYAKVDCSLLLIASHGQIKSSCPNILYTLVYLLPKSVTELTGDSAKCQYFLKKQLQSVANQANGGNKIVQKSLKVWSVAKKKLFFCGNDKI